MLHLTVLILFVWIYWNRCIMGGLFFLLRLVLYKINIFYYVMKLKKNFLFHSVTIQHRLLLVQHWPVFLYGGKPNSIQTWAHHLVPWGTDLPFSNIPNTKSLIDKLRNIGSTNSINNRLSVEALPLLHNSVWSVYILLLQAVSVKKSQLWYNSKGFAAKSG